MALRGRKKLELNKAELQQVITKLEQSQIFANLSELFLAVENTEWAKTMDPRPLKAPVVYQRCKELGIVCKTVPGKRGNPNLGKTKVDVNGVTVAPIKRSRAEKLTSFTKSFAQMRDEFPKEYHSLIVRAQAGSLKSSVRLKCIECSGFVKGEVSKCNVSACALYPFRK